MNNKGRYIFVINYKQKKGNDWTEFEHATRKGSINNQWFLMADYVVDTKEGKVLKNRKNILSNEQILTAYNSL